MNEDPRFRQYGFSHYEQPQQAEPGFVETVAGPGIAQKLRSPVVATVALLLAGAAFAGVILATYPSDDAQDAVPVVQADVTAFKEVPSDPGGMDIENRDSTIFMSMSGSEATEEGAPVENLLGAEEQPSGALEDFASQVEEVIEEESAAASGAVENLLDSQDQGDNIEELAAKIDQVDVPEPATKPSTPVEEAADTSTVAAVAPQKPAVMHKPGASPETLEFVKSVLDKKDGRVAAAAAPTRTHDVSDAAMGAASIQPAAGAARPAAITPGSYYVQLGSVTSASGAEGEWGKLQKKFASELSGLEHRVKSADLGERGTFYRIQAGPMSKASANSLCDSIKAQKPGGCLVTQ